jgi:hypothetical protein
MVNQKAHDARVLKAYVFQPGQNDRHGYDMDAPVRIHTGSMVGYDRGVMRTILQSFVERN